MHISPSIQLVEKSCALALINGLGHDGFFYQPYYVPGGEWREDTEREFRALIDEFDKGSGRFKPAPTNSYSCPGRSGLIVNINQYQRGTWGELLAELEFKEVWSFYNPKSANRIYVYVRAKKGCE